MERFITDRPFGGVGKNGFLRLEFELDSSGRSILRNLERRAPLIAQQELYFDEEMPEMPCLYILSSGGPNVDGDRYEQHIVVKERAYAHISTGAATKIASMRHDCSKMSQRITLENDAYLEFLPEPIIPCAHSRYISDTLLCVAPSATLVYSEIYLSGRKHHAGESFKYDILSVTTRGERADGQRLFQERFVLQPALGPLDRKGIMDGFDTFASVVVMAPPESAEKIYTQTSAYWNAESGLAAGITRLPNDCGLMFRVLGSNTSRIKGVVREFCSKVRMVIKGHHLPHEFPWR